MDISGSLVKKIPAPLPAILDFSLYSNLFVAFITASASFYYQNLVGLISFEYLIFLFFSTLFIYNFEQRKVKSRDFINKPLRSFWLIKNKRKIDLITITSLAVSLAFLTWNFDILKVSGAILTLLLCLVYCSDTFLQKIALLKNLLLAVIWSGATVIMPHIWLSQEITSYTAFSLFLMISLINSLLCDRDDKKGDEKDGLRSLALKMSKRSFVVTLLILNGLIVILSIKTEFREICLTALCYGYFTIRPIKSGKALYVYDLCLILPLMIKAILPVL